uniref:protein-serine/threonine phosphatase n=1 Tax=Clastoptera arizonana TaxID=38151 RepID=A0A1B6DM71_9HEMI
MGAYLSEPKTDKVSSDHDGERLKCGASSMQGWRTSQEDAHNCIIDYDNEASLFAVYDGHGGHEVAEYCSKYLPDFIKSSVAYKNGNFHEALKEAFLDFDATLAKPEVISVLKEIAGAKDLDKTNSDTGDEDDEDFTNLVKEAHMPLDQVMAQYQKGEMAKPVNRLLGKEKHPGSPYLRARTSLQEGASTSGAGPSCSSSSIFDDGEVSSSSSNHNTNIAKSSKVMCNGGLTNGNSESEIGGSEDGKVSDQVAGSDEANDIKQKRGGDSKIKDGEDENNILTDSCSIKEKIKSSKTEIDETAPDSSGDPQNGEQHGVSSSSQNGDSEENGKISSSSCERPKRIPYKYKLLEESLNSESEDDESFQGSPESENVEVGSGEDDDEATEECEEEEEDDEDDDEEDDSDISIVNMKEEPGSDSGCTAVVALVKGSEVFVANAGDSRCVVCREGKAIDMSFDHKPEDEPERQRIEKAGGKVTGDGRVNGGLNLSRALGDHSYKQTSGLPATEQMITALPDIMRLEIDPLKDEFMILACDGIWNFMSSQEVVDFVLKEIRTGVKLSKICEQLFDHCLAPNTQGDGTGCDNMTCVIVQFKYKDASLKPSTDASQKRSLSSPVDSSESAKRIKLDVTSSN